MLDGNRQRWALTAQLLEQARQRAGSTPRRRQTAQLAARRPSKVPCHRRRSSRSPRPAAPSATRAAVRGADVDDDDIDETDAVLGQLGDLRHLGVERGSPRRSVGGRSCGQCFVIGHELTHLLRSRWSRASAVPSVANSSTSSAARSRARAPIPSRFATESRARTVSPSSFGHAARKPNYGGAPRPPEIAKKELVMLRADGKPRIH